MSCSSEAWNVEQAAAFLRMPPEALLFLGDHGAGPRRSGVGWFVEYEPDEVREWLWSCGRPVSAPTGRRQRDKGRRKSDG